MSTPLFCKDKMTNEERAMAIWIYQNVGALKRAPTSSYLGIVFILYLIRSIGKNTLAKFYFSSNGH